MSLDTTTLTGTNIPDIAARTVEGRAASLLYAPIKAACEAFWAAFGLSYTFYADGTGASLVLSTEAKALLTAMAATDPTTGWPAIYWSTAENAINSRIATDYADQATPLLDIST